MKSIKEVKEALEKSRGKIAKMSNGCVSEDTKQKLLTGMNKSIGLCSKIINDAEGKKQ